MSEARDIGSFEYASAPLILLSFKDEDEDEDEDEEEEEEEEEEDEDEADRWYATYFVKSETVVTRPPMAPYTPSLNRGSGFQTPSYKDSNIYR